MNKTKPVVKQKRKKLEVVDVKDKKNDISMKTSMKTKKQRKTDDPDMETVDNPTSSPQASTTKKEEHKNCNRRIKKIKTHHQAVNKDFKVGDYVIVKYWNKLYPGVIQQLKNREYEISAMAKTEKTRWKWPTPPDKIWYKEEDIIKKIPVPKAHITPGVFTADV
ncbi:hypothetical protein QE152_g40577 [Popillia japonica]|uniref:Uncharacterized protein n=1 Tax=Popillia japonica TaxID=7064 RepID=A0AAW1HFV7_POPJA